MSKSMACLTSAQLQVNLSSVIYFDMIQFCVTISKDWLNDNPKSDLLRNSIVELTQ